MQHMTNITNLSDIISPMESIPSPDCGNCVPISPHPNSHFIDGMDDCLYHGQCRNIACQNCSKKKRYSLSVLHVWPPIIINLLMVQQPVCKKHQDCHQTRKITTAYEFNEVLEKIINPGKPTTIIRKRFVI